MENQIQEKDAATGSKEKPSATATEAPFRERRKHPRISETPPAPAPPPKLEDYVPIIGQAYVDELRYLATTSARQVAQDGELDCGGRRRGGNSEPTDSAHE